MYPAAAGGGCEGKITFFPDAARESRQDARSLDFKMQKNGPPKRAELQGERIEENFDQKA